MLVVPSRYASLARSLSCSSRAEMRRPASSSEARVAAISSWVRISAECACS